MPLNKLNFKSGITSDITPYSNEGGFVDCDKIRFRLGTPEKWVAGLSLVQTLTQDLQED